MNGSPESKNVVTQLGDVTFGMACSDVVRKEKKKKKEIQYGSTIVFAFTYPAWFNFAVMRW